MATKKATATAAQARASQLRTAELQRQRRTRAYTIVGVLVGLALFSALVYFIVSTGTKQGPTPTAASENEGFRVVAEGLVPDNSEGADEGLVRVDVYLDFMCPICLQFELTNQEDLEELIADGTAVVYYHPISILDRASLGSEYSTRSASAAATVAEYAPEYFLAYVKALYASQPDENTSGLSDAQLAEVARLIEVPEEVVARIADGEFMDWAGRATERASRDGMRGTPYITVEGIEFTGPWYDRGQLRFAIEFTAGITPTVFFNPDGTVAHPEDQESTVVEPTPEPTPSPSN